MEQWEKYIKAFLNSILDFLKNPIIVVYFISIVVIIGGFGVWYNWFDYNPKDDCPFWDYNNLGNLATYSISMIAATMADFLLSKKENGKGIKIFSFSLFLLSFISSIIAMVKYKYIFGLVGLGIAYLLWIIVYSNDDSKRPDTTPNPNGGINPQNTPIIGNTNSFQV